jgi:hypothetical protein
MTTGHLPFFQDIILCRQLADFVQRPLWSRAAVAGRRMAQPVYPQALEIAGAFRHLRFVPQTEVLAPHYARLSDHRETKALIEPSSRIVLEDFKHNLLPR